MKALELKILNKKRDLKEQLAFAIAQFPISLRVAKDLKFEIAICDSALKELRSKRAKARLG